MITNEMLSQNSILSILTEEQRSAIIELSTNDERSVLAKTSQQLSDSISSVLLEKSGTARNKGEADSDYIARVVGGYNDRVNTLNTANKDLSDKLKAAANLPEEVESRYKKQIADQKKLNETLTSTLASKEKEYTDALSAKEASINAIHLDYAFRDALNGIKFKSAFTPELQGMLLSSAKAEVLSTVTPDFMEENGERKLVFRDSTGSIKLNVANGLKPYTLSELLMQTSLKDAIDTENKKPGGGTKPPTGGGSGGSGSFVVSATTQVEADKEIGQYLLSIGITKDSPKYFVEMSKIRKENGVDKLKIQ